MSDNVVIAVCVVLLSAIVVNLVRRASPQRKHVVLLWGQSNMAGRGSVAELNAVAYYGRADVLALTDDGKRWVFAEEPLRRDRVDKDPGVGPGVAFGVEVQRMRRLKEVGALEMVGLVPSAVGGSSLREWHPLKGPHYKAALAHARAALAEEDAELSAILWHQGESDSIEAEDAATYGVRMRELIAHARSDLRAPALPFIVGELGHFLSERRSVGGAKMLPYSAEVSRHLKALAEGPIAVDSTAFVSAAELGHRGDHLHFSTAAQLELGRRYAVAWSALANGGAPTRVAAPMSAAPVAAAPVAAAPVAAAPVATTI